MKSFVTAAAGTAMALAGLMALAPQDAQAQQGRNNNAPRGSYAQTCGNVAVNQGRLFAVCETMRGTQRASSIEVSRCVGDIANDDGLLVCHGVRGQFENDYGRNDRDDRYDRDDRRDRDDRYDRDDRGGNGGWNGNGRQTITVYRDAGFRGPSQRLQGEVRDLSRTGLNDMISSMEFRGEWQVCTDANFRGQCRTFRDNVRNLDRSGFNDRISSLRPVLGRDRY